MEKKNLVLEILIMNFKKIIGFFYVLDSKMADEPIKSFMNEEKRKIRLKKDENV